MRYSLSTAVLWTLVIATLSLTILSEPRVGTIDSSVRTELDHGNQTNFADKSFDPDRAHIADIASSLGTQLELSISAVNLPANPDAMCVVYTRPFNSFIWTEYERTETIKDESYPKFTKKITMPYTFEEKLVFNFKVYNRHHSRGDKLEDRHLIGFAICNQGELIREGRMQLPMKRIRPNGTELRVLGAYIIITAEQLTSNFDEVVMKLSGRGLDKLDWFSLSDPYIEIYRIAPEKNTEKDTLVCRTEVIMNSLNPDWQMLTIPVKVLCNGERKRLLKFVCWDWDKNSTPDLIGEFVTTLDEIDGLKKRSFELKHPEKAVKKNETKPRGLETI